MQLFGNKILSFLVIAGFFAAGLVWFAGPFSGGKSSSAKKSQKNVAVPIEATQIQHGSIEQLRTFSGALEPRAEFVVAPKVSGRVVKLLVHISDMVNRGELVGELDNGEYIQEVAQAKADLAVAKANLAESKSDLEVAEREFERVKTLRARGVASEAQLDAASANQLAKQVEKEVAQARVMRAESGLETANIRLGYTRITAGWTDGADQRVVAERFVDEGEMVSANTPLLRIVELSPITGVIYVTERDYAHLQLGQQISLVTDAYPGEKFHGFIERIAPVFKEETRQARVELRIENSERRLKPGMFIRATIVIDRAEDAFIIPFDAITERDDQTGIFLVNNSENTVVWKQVRTGIRQGNVIQILGEGLSGKVVTLGQQLLNDGVAVTIPGDDNAATPSEQKVKRQ